MNAHRPFRSGAALSAAALMSILFASAVSAEVSLKNEPRPPGIQVHDSDDGLVFADQKGMTLYTAEFDNKRGESRCPNTPQTQGTSLGGDPFVYPNPANHPSCLSQHPPVDAKGAAPVGRWTIIDSTDGGKQWAYDGRALYTNIKDVRPGDTNGFLDLGGRNPYSYGTFTALQAPVILPPEVRIGKIGIARVLVTAQDSRTLYVSADDPKGQSKCAGACAATWRPLIAPLIAKEQGGWTVVKRADSTLQWALGGKPLYTYEADMYAGDTKGDRRPGWSVALAHPLPKQPDGIMVVHTVIGPRYADRKGMTLYIWNCAEQGLTGCDNPTNRSVWWMTTCGTEDKCADMWRPVLADEMSKPEGFTWSLVTLQEPWAPVRAAEGQPGKKAWAYKGKPVFTFKYEDRPGMIEAEDMGVNQFHRWSSIQADGYDINQPPTPSELRAAAR